MSFVLNKIQKSPKIFRIGFSSILTLFFCVFSVFVYRAVDQRLPAQFAEAATATTTWTGLGDGTSWTDAANWNNGVPDATKDAVITIASAVTTTISGTVNFDSLILGGSSASNTVLLTGFVSGNDIVIDNNGTLIQNNSSTEPLNGTLTVKSGGLLTHTSNTTTQAFSVNFAANSFDIQAGGRIDVDGRGYRGGVTGALAGRGPGGGGGTGGTGAGGGGHGGSGAKGTSASGTGGSVYCNPTAVPIIGSGGGSEGAGDNGGNGGGLIRLIATSTITINGTVSAKGRARGESGTTGTYNGGGSGGGIRLTANVFAGTPVSVTALGGTGGSASGGGGGGCVEVIYTTSNSISSGAISASGGSGGSGGNRTGGAGQIFVQQVGSEGDLYILGTGTPDAGTPQFIASLSVNSITVSSSASYGIPSGDTLTLSGGSPLLGDRSGSIATTGTIALNATNTISNVSISIVSGGVFTNQSILNVGSGISFTLGAGSTVTNPITAVNTSGTLNIYQSSTHRIASTANLTIGSGTTSFYGYVTTTSPMVLGDITVKSGAFLTHGANTTTQINVLNIAATNIDVQSGGSINVDGKGYRGGITGSLNGRGPGAGTGTGASGAGGGAYGGNGAKGVTNNGGAAYCDPTNISNLGSGGGVDSTTGGGAGGGLILLTVTSTLTINGTITARGYSSADAFTTNQYSAGGSGGGVKLVADTITGTPTSFTVVGGTGGSSSGGGGGGCVNITYTTSNSLNPVTMMSMSGGGGVRSGGAGVVMLKQASGNGDLYVIAGGSANAGSGQNASSITVNTITVSSSAAYGIPTGGTLTLLSATPLLGDWTGSITATGTFVLSATNTISYVSAAIATGGVFTGLSTLNVATSSSFTLGAGSTVTNPLTTVNTSGTLIIYQSSAGGFSSNTALTIGSGTTTLYGYSTATSPLVLGSLTIKSGAYLTHGVNVSTQANILNIAATNVELQPGGGIAIAGKGYQGGLTSHLGGYGPGAGAGTGANGAGGGAHGGNGGNGISNIGGTAYCSSTNPTTIGSGGGTEVGSINGGHGGGLLLLTVTSTFTFNGWISASGRIRGDTDANSTYNGGGAGGGVNITATTITGTPSLFSAAGGAGGTASGGGGGGCVSIAYSSLTGTATSSVTVAGGSGGNASGSIGTTNFSSTAAPNTLPTATAPYPVQSSASLITVTSTIADTDLNATTLGVEYSTDNSTWINATIASVSENGEGDGATTSTGFISGIDTTSDGSVDLTFTWNAGLDLPNTEDPSVYFRITPNDGTASGTTMTSAAFAVDTKVPSAPGSLTVNTTSTRSVTFNFGSAATDQSFDEYIIYYKAGSSGVTTSDFAYTSSSNSNLSSISFGGASTITLSDLFATSTQYVANIWAYDTFNRSTSSTSETAFYTLADTPGTPTVTASSSATVLDLVINQATNPSTVTYSICRTTNGTSCAAGSSFVQSNGSLGASAVYQLYTAWGGASGFEITGLTPNTGYRFLVQGNNGDGVVTSYSSANSTVTTTNVGVNLSATTATATEGGSTGSYTIVLNSKPSSDVTVTLTSDSAVTTTARTYPFTTGNWNVAQTVTVTAVNDSIAQGTHAGTITHTVTSADANYNGLTVSDVTVTITDNDSSGVTLSTTTVATTEGGATDSYTIVLNTQPTSTVTVTVSPDSGSTVSTSSVAFTSSNWNTAVTVTVTAVDDSIAQGTHSSTITHSVSSQSTGYSGAAISSVTNTITDNDSAGVTLNNTTVATTEGGVTDSYTIVLNTQPTSTVTVTVSPDSGSTVSTSSVAFTSSNWNTAVTVTVTAVDDSIAQGTHSSTITHSISSASTGYNGAGSSVTNTITDNDVASTGGGAVGSPGTPSIPPPVTTYQQYDPVTGTYLTQPPEILTNPLLVPPPIVLPELQPEVLIKKYFFPRTLSLGSIGEDVRQLQLFLNANGFLVADSGPGSAGEETTKFGSATRSALLRFQQAHLTELFGPSGSRDQANGVFGPSTRSFVNGTTVVLPPAATALYGRILLQVQQHGEAWYVHPETGTRSYMKDGAAAYGMMRNFGLGITDEDLSSIPSVQTVEELKNAVNACSLSAVGNRTKGWILLQVEQHGEAWYVDPVTCRRIYMKDGEVAYTMMRYLGLGITDADLATITVGQ